ncbi:hypothetical protein J6590_076845 [Homalodisca vitripennis]|nr:hypothetical protein J6590_076845 [Homalodisca vitripennis]
MSNVQPTKKGVAITRPWSVIMVNPPRSTYNLLCPIRASLMGMTLHPHSAYTPLYPYKIWRRGRTPDTWSIVTAPQSPQPCRNTTTQTIYPYQPEYSGQRKTPPQQSDALDHPSSPSLK